MVHKARLYSPQTTVAIAVAVVWLCGEVERDERAPGPIEKARREAKMPSQHQPTQAIIPRRTPRMPAFGLVHEVPEKRILIISPSMPARSKYLRAKWPVDLTVTTPKRKAVIKRGHSLPDCFY